MNDFIKNFIKNPIYRFNILNRLGYYNYLNDEEFLKKEFKIRMGRELNLNEPKSFNEKLQWLKLYYREPLLTDLVDKYNVRSYIKNTIGKDFLIPLLGMWDNPDDINFDILPDQFVLKCNHNSGVGLCICKDKKQLNKDLIIKKLKKGLHENYYIHNREWPYKNVKRRVIAEKYIHDEEKNYLTDYKFYCFNGKAKYLYVAKGLDEHRTAQMSFLTLDWEFAYFGRSDYKPLSSLPKKPTKLKEMIEIAEILAKDFPFVRVDLYQIGEKILFGELTFSPCGGFMPFSPEAADRMVGNDLVLPSISKK